MQDMFENHFNQQELPSEIATLIELCDVLHNHSKNLRAMQITCIPISSALTIELSDLAMQTSTVVDLFVNVVDARLQELYNAHKKQ